MEPDTDAEWWTTSEVAAYLGLRVSTVSTYRKRNQMPAPDQSLGRTHLWKPQRIIDWHDARPRPGVGGRPIGTAHALDVDQLRPAESDESRWKVHGERTLYESKWITLGLADVELPDGQRFEHHVVTMPPAAMAAVLDNSGNVLLMWRHRFAPDIWNWELPGGLIEPGEDPAGTVVREIEEETGYRAGTVQHLVTFEPMVGMVRNPNHVYLVRNAIRVGEPTETTEMQQMEWVPLIHIPRMISEGLIQNSGTLIALLHVLAISGKSSTAAH